MPKPSRTDTVVPVLLYAWRFEGEGDCDPHYFCQFDFRFVGGPITSGVIVRDESFGCVDLSIVELAQRLRHIPSVLSVSIDPHSIELEIDLNRVCWRSFNERCAQAITPFLLSKGLGRPRYKEVDPVDEKPDMNM